jgi:CheY-like chemotaxis protein
VHPAEAAPDPDEPQGEATPGFFEPSDLQGLRVLVVDDHADARRLIMAVLEHCGAETASAASAGEALDAMETFEPHVLVSDIGMPGEDGYTLIKNVRQREEPAGRRTPAMALTAYARAQEKEKALASGFQQYAVKPIEPARLVRLVAQLAGREAAPPPDNDLPQTLHD